MEFNFCKKSAYYINPRLLLRLNLISMFHTWNDDTASVDNPSTYGPKMLCSLTLKLCFPLENKQRENGFSFHWISQCKKRLRITKSKLESIKAYHRHVRDGLLFHPEKIRFALILGDKIKFHLPFRIEQVSHPLVVYLHVGDFDFVWDLGVIIFHDPVEELVTETWDDTLVVHCSHHCVWFSRAYTR